MPEAAAPAAPAATGAPAAPDIPQSATVEAPFNDAFAELDRMISEPGDEPKEEKSTETPKPDATDKKVSDKKGADEKNNKGLEEAAKKKQQDKGQKVEDQAEKSGQDGAGSDAKAVRKTPWQLVHQYEAEIATLRKDLETSKSSSGSVKEHPDYKAVQEELKSAKSRADDLESKIRFVSYKDSQEFKDSYEKPYVDAWITGRSRVAGMTVTVDPDTGSTRQGKAEDFDQLMKIHSDDDAAEFAAVHFGNKASAVLYHRERVQELSAKADRAVEEYKTKGSEQEKQAREQSETFNKTVGTEVGRLWTDTIKAAEEKYPQWSKPVEGDEKGNQLLAKGVELANKAFASFNVFDPRLSKEQRAEMVKSHTALFNKAAWFDRLAYADAQKARKISELEKQLEDYKQSEPGAGSGRRSANGAGAIPSWEDELDKLTT
jgi:hypothetical protein